MPRPRRRLPFGSLKPFVAATAAAGFLVAACSPEPTGINPTAVRVVLITLDGLRPEAMTSTHAPTLVLLAKQGAATFKAQTVLPSLTLPSHASMVTGLLPENHRVTWNDDITSDSTHVGSSTIFDLAQRAGVTTAMFVGKQKLNAITHVGAPPVLDMPPPGQIWKADTVAAHLRSYLTAARDQKPGLMLIHLPDIDLAGHAFGWMSPEYLTAVRHTDSVFARIWLDLKLNYGTDLVLIVTADHGGSGKGHANGTNLDLTIPWVAWGKYVEPQMLTANVRAIDIAPTMLWVLGISPSVAMDGAPVKSAFPALTH
jgi:predicted AlkP superfamily pyrophosphatase or phosphodiesterase